jgi:hypothetical protein
LETKSVSNKLKQISSETLQNEKIIREIVLQIDNNPYCGDRLEISKRSPQYGLLSICNTISLIIFTL